MLHKELHREAASTKEQEVPNILNKNWSDNVGHLIKRLLQEG